MTLVLRIGLVASLVILAAGLVAYLVLYPSSSSGTVIGSNPILRYLGLAGLAQGLASGSVEAYLTLGLLVLVATPVVRVVAGLYYFARGHERAMTAFTSAVTVLLLVGLLVLGPWIR
jgi:uncharacterized membrane protein